MQIFWDTIQVNWSVYLQMIISSFLGFGSALLVQEISNRIDDKKKREEIKKSLRIELNSILSTINSLELQKSYINPYSIPRWKGIKDSGSLQYLDESNTTITLIEVFNRVEEANMVEMKGFELLFLANTEMEQNVVFDILQKSRTELKVVVDEAVLALAKEVN